MNLPVMPWCNLLLQQSQKCHNLAWFLYGCAEREHLLNMDAWVTWWTQAFTLAPSRAPSYEGRRSSRIGV